MSKLLGGLVVWIAAIGFAIAHCSSYAEDVNTAQTFFETAYDYAKKGNFAVAVEMYRKGLEHAPKNQDGHYFLADALEKMGEHDKEAIAEYTIARDLNPKSERGVQAVVKIIALQQMPAALPQQKESRDCDRCPDMVVVPAGSPQMGSPANDQRLSSRVTKTIGKITNAYPQYNYIVFESGEGVKLATGTIVLVVSAANEQIQFEVSRQKGNSYSAVPKKETDLARLVGLDILVNQ